jgi:hypothetical protein
MKARDAHDDSARDAETQIRLIELGSVSTECDAAFDTLTRSRSHLAQLTLHDFLESGRSRRKNLQR